MTAKTIYKICSKEEWEIACANRCFKGAAIDVRDGFIHFSTASQVKETARRHFKARHGLVLVAVEAGSLGSDLKWEVSRGGDLFPHLFGVLDVDKATSVTALPVAGDGSHIFPALDE